MSNYNFNTSLIQDYQRHWANLVITRPHDIETAANLIISHKDRYKELEGLTNVPWYFIGICHYRESDCNFGTHLHNGDSLRARTHNVPAGRPIKGSPPFSFNESAIDALGFQGFLGQKDWSIERISYRFETFNGFGYRMNGVPSAYLYSGTNQYTRGKYVADHVFDPTVADVQVGTMGILKIVAEKEGITFPQVDQQTTSVPPVTTSPKAIPAKPTTSEMNQMSRKHWWTDTMQWIGYLFGGAGVAVKTAQTIDLQQTKSTIQTVQEIAQMIGVFGVILAAVGLIIYCMYMKSLMKEDVQLSRATPSNAPENQNIIVPDAPSDSVGAAPNV